MNNTGEAELAVLLDTLSELDLFHQPIERQEHLYNQFVLLTTHQCDTAHPWRCRQLLFNAIIIFQDYYGGSSEQQLRFNLIYIQQYADRKEDLQTAQMINQICEYIMIDLSYMDRFDQADLAKELNDIAEDLQERMNAAEKELEKVQTLPTQVDEMMERAEDNLVNTQREYIAILGIFSAVVLTFTGGIAFTTSVLNNIAQSSIYRTVAISLVIGLVLLNVLYGLFYYINATVQQNKSIKPLLISNSVLLILLLGTIGAWFFGVTETRDQRINTTMEASQETILTTP